jgi:hypothetical protein
MYTLQRKPDQHVTRIPRSVRVWSQTIRISRSQRIATFHEVVNSDGQSNCSRKKGSWHNTQHTGWLIHGSISSFSSKTTIEAVGVKSPFIDGRLLGLPGLYHRHAIGTFNTCSWGPTHRSLTDTDGGYNHLRAPPNLRLSNVNIASGKKWQEAPIAEPWPFDHSASIETYIYS